MLLEEFNERTSRYHLRKVQELIHHLSHYLYLVKANKNETGPALAKFEYESKELQFNDVLKPKLRPDLLLVESAKPAKLNVQHLGLSQFNPPSSQRQWKGDLFYIHLKTNEGVDYVITASTLGFYLNSSVNRSFDPTPKSDEFYNLIDLIADLSPSFKKELANAQPEPMNPSVPAY